MRKLILLFLPVLMMAATVFVWNYDPLDTYFDPEVGDTVNAAYWLDNTLRDLGHQVNVGTTLPADLSGYDVCFVTLGWFRC